MEIVKGIEIRSEVLKYSLLIENFTAIFLSNLLDISNYKESRTLGNKSGNLSFNQKVHLLIDIKALDKNEKKKFLIFMSIRNQFIHNYDADCYEGCFHNIDGAETFILRTYPQDVALSKEQQLESAFRKLANDIVSTTFKLLDKVKEKFSKQIEKEILENYKENSAKAIKEIENVINKTFEDKLEKGETSIEISKLQNLGTKVRSIYYAHMIAGMTEKKVS